MAEDFKTIRMAVPVSDKLGSVTMEIYEPTLISSVLTIGHGAGSNLDQAFLKQLAAALASRQICTMRFNFVYSENRKKMPDRFPTASAAIRAVIDDGMRRYPGKPFFCGGKSFGGRMSSMTLAENHIPKVNGLVFFGFPLHPAGSPAVDRAEHLKNVQVPMLFLQGTKDALATPALLRPVIASLPQAKLVEFEGADHSFKGGKQTSIQAIAEATSDWINKHT